MANPMEIKAVFANQISLTINENGVRIAFGEAISKKDSSYHTAIFMPHAIAMQFEELYTTNLKKFRN